MTAIYSRIYLQTIIAVRDAKFLLPLEHREELHHHISEVIENKMHHALAVQVLPDHVHLLFDLRPEASVADLVRDVKASTARYITDQDWVNGLFRWQEGFAAFSYSHSQVPAVISYLANQEKHHERVSLKDELIELLSRFEVAYDPKSLLAGDELDRVRGARSK